MMNKPITQTIEFSGKAGQVCNCTECNKPINVGSYFHRKGLEILCKKCDSFKKAEVNDGLSKENES